MAQVVLQNVSKSFAGPKKQPIPALKDFNLSVNDGELVVLVGPSGAGKTTVLRLIAGLEEVSSGSISIDGRVVNDVPAQDRDIAMVFQSFALYPHMTAYENIAFPLRLRKRPKAEIAQRVKEAAEMLGLGGLLERKPNTLSGGERQRVALGRALVRQPKVFLFDEPLSNLDPATRLQMRTEISRLHQRVAATMIYVTHDQVEAMTLGDRIVVMKEGTVQQVGKPVDLYIKPANMFVAGFIGSPPMNFIAGTVLENAEGVVFVAGPNGPKLSLRLEKEQSQAFRGHLNSAVVFGIRAEDLAFADNATGLNTFPAVVELIEPTGADTFVHLRAGSMGVILRALGTTTIQVGEQMQIASSTRKAHFFEAASRRRIV